MASNAPSKPNIIVNHVGFLTDGVKRGVFPADAGDEFELQDMLQNDAEALGSFENWKVVFRGRLEAAPAALGDYRIGDFTAWRKPGVYRLTLPGGRGWSFMFAIHDGILADIPPLFLQYIRGNRCGDFENAWRGPCHLDDAVLNPGGRPIDVTGGWHDAGDTRKWMTHCTLPALAFARWVASRRQAAALDDAQAREYLAEIAWGLRFIPKMQDPATGMIYEDVGGGGDSRRQEGMTWWCENVSGCCADNVQNRFTDNIPGSGDERPVRTTYNPLVQYSNTLILMESAALLAEAEPALATAARQTAAACWRFMEGRRNDEYHGWTSMRAWRLLAALAMRGHAAGGAAVDAALSALLELWSPQTAFWFLDAARADSYRGVLQSAQPLIALAALVEAVPDHPRRREIEGIVRRCIAEYVSPLCATNAFGYMPYGLYFHPPTTADRYRRCAAGRTYRLFMPAHSSHRVNMGLSAHATSWAHGLAYCARVFDLPEACDLAFNQLFWLLGNNPAQVSFVTGVGYNNPMPHSRAFGLIPGGFMNGPRGNAEDEIFIDTAGHGDWSTCEYWNPIGANAVMALVHLLPARPATDRKLGRA
jgi:hypothetical protein